ncbi:PTS system fructose subfamily transporter subunit IIA [Clostridium gasigenes]|uniref:PTS sugar transporter subunit IIA n=1 Tax=Clostridium gasigenes TaxID=94869 RepID=UPI001C0E48AF|nr:PTS system fructose subfamily transporter subunit IIA [Clostridium gasigenes]MBU3108095.1 PTS system fructose subfamily transporter subunit IIA [Clostridium gasigenes]MBU3133858.1 PTS system fructose subfamily transporter subunit IIA [Clostridium gasigenes]
MVQVIIVSHGNNAIEIINSIESIHGVAKNLKAITLSESESLKELTDKLNFEIENSIYDEFLVLVDFLGGTPYNATQKLIGKSNVEIITGFNTPMLLKLVSMENKTLKEISYIAEESGKLGIVNISNLVKKRFQENNLEDSLNENNI